MSGALHTRIRMPLESMPKKYIFICSGVSTNPSSRSHPASAISMRPLPQMASQDNIAINGAGLAGLCLALSHEQQDIPCHIYELRKAPLDIGGAITVSPNALQNLDKLGVNNSLLRQSTGEPFDTYEIGSVAKYGYPGLQIHCYILNKGLLTQCTQKGIPIMFGTIFSRIVSESEAGVTWELNNTRAIPPSSEQGANQVFEDYYTYALMHIRRGAASLDTVLLKWQRGRQERIDRLIILAEQMNVRRLPKANDHGLAELAGTEDFNMEWLFKPELDKMVKAWLAV
ncbi:hypothetical protein BO83DRAFT_392634 [Aspergillus eucalypticola CBS 122712]|uniref:FAD-binding domain-containing protein n=1 Tax=Aspergillus eucalypticola (strain CBS 122712 / IBT 29274) TaxID=1448314 RepID=A0A317UUU8_ASPEC|nr:uncharacterized protein BO83DRAFT_392634 [Aspergillus eucalypticola CBS 122712]PWY64317.1 hypothetical protein BO83DRAFT_392634 [Aspergillus eucalypticola CBS 122712]